MKRLRNQSPLGVSICLILFGAIPFPAFAEFPPETGGSPLPMPGIVWSGMSPTLWTLRDAMRQCKKDKFDGLQMATSTAPPSDGFNESIRLHTDCQKRNAKPEIQGDRISIVLELGRRFDLPSVGTPPDPVVPQFTYWSGTTAWYYPLKDDEEDAGKSLGKNDCSNICIGNPIVVNASNKYQDEVDYAGSGGRGLKFHRFYNSAPEAQAALMGPNWRYSYSRALQITQLSSTRRAISAVRDDGMEILFRESNGIWTASSDIRLSIEPVLAGGIPTAWELKNPSDSSVETYDTSGRLLAIDYADGYHIDLTYSSGRLSRVTDPQGRFITLGYQSNGLLSTLTDPSAVVYTYEYGTPSFPTLPEFSERRLKKVTATSGLAREYRYDDGSVEPNRRGVLLEIIDEAGAQKASFTYDAQGNPISTEHRDGAERYVIEPGQNGSTDIVYANGMRMKHYFTKVKGRTLPFRIERTCDESCETRQINLSYDSNGFPDKVEWFGGSADYDYNAKGQVIQKKEGASSNTRTTQTDWHPQFDSPVEERLYDAGNNLWLKKNWTYNARGQVVTSSQTDSTTNEIRTTTVSYCETGDVQAGICPIIGLLTKVDGPRTNVNDVSNVSYYMSDDSGCNSFPSQCAYRKGDIKKISNAAGHTTQYLRYDLSGRPIAIMDENSIVTDLEFNTRGWLIRSIIRGDDASSESDDAITTMEYDLTGLLKKTTDPDGVVARYEYDTAGRLTSVYAASGDRIVYTLDNEGRAEKTEVQDTTGALTFTMTTLRNVLGLVKSSTDAFGKKSTATFWPSGLQNYTTDPLGVTSTQTPDELGRVKQVVLNSNKPPAIGHNFQYDPLNNLLQVTDAYSRETVYSRNKFGDIVKLNSRTTGIATSQYDTAGNEISHIDADGRKAIADYDALNRKTGISYPSDLSLNVTYTYDASSALCLPNERFNIGQLTRTTDASGSTDYCYSRMGRIARKIQTINGKIFTSTFEYTKGGRLAEMVYPSGMRVSYSSDINGNVSSVKLTPTGQASQSLLSAVSYYPFGPIRNLTFGNGRVLARTYNLNYQPVSIVDSAQDGLAVGLEFDAAGNLSVLRSGGQSGAPLRKYEYDTLGQLTAVKNGANDAPIKTYIYNNYTANRTSEITNGASSTASDFDSTSDRLLSWGGVARTYDLAGNTTSIGGSARQFEYNAAGRMSSVKVNGASVMSYRYAANGERVMRQSSSGTDYTIYDTIGHFVGRYNQAGAASSEVIWLGDMPIGVFTGNKLYYVQTDHLNSPRTIIDPVRQKAVWRWSMNGDVFGGTPPEQDPDQDGASFNFELRFPGQLFDAVSGTHYNMHRDYDPTTARYLQSDPIGLIGGRHTYNYVSNSPLTWADPSGLLQWTERPRLLLRDVVPGQPMRTWPTAPISLFKSNTAARTSMDWTLGTTCQCDSGQFRLNEFSVDIGTRIHLRKSYSTFQVKMATISDEMDHVRDIRTWFSVAQPALVALEGNLKSNTYGTEAECISKNQQELESYMDKGAQQTVNDSWVRWDKSGKHFTPFL